jgi:hypothetical protein
MWASLSLSHAVAFITLTAAIQNCHYWIPFRRRRQQQHTLLKWQAAAADLSRGHNAGCWCCCGGGGAVKSRDAEIGKMPTTQPNGDEGQEEEEEE